MRIRKQIMAVLTAVLIAGNALGAVPIYAADVTGAQTVAEDIQDTAEAQNPDVDVGEADVQQEEKNRQENIEEDSVQTGSLQEDSADNEAAASAKEMKEADSEKADQKEENSLPEGAPDDNTAKDTVPEEEMQSEEPERGSLHASFEANTDESEFAIQKAYAGDIVITVGYDVQAFDSEVTLHAKEISHVQHKTDAEDSETGTPVTSYIIKDDVYFTDEDGNEVEPKPGSRVEVMMEYTFVQDQTIMDLQVIHEPDEGEAQTVAEGPPSDQPAVEFSLDSFSIITTEMTAADLAYMNGTNDFIVIKPGDIKNMTVTTGSRYSGSYYFKWETSDPSVATVTGTDYSKTASYTDTQTITAVSPGTATITVRHYSRSWWTSRLVEQSPPTSWQIYVADDTVGIVDTVNEDGKFHVDIHDDRYKTDDYVTVWQRASGADAGVWTTVQRTKVTGQEYNTEGFGAEEEPKKNEWVNVAVDSVEAGVQGSERYWYKASVYRKEDVEENGLPKDGTTPVASSVPTRVQDYVQIQNGSFENPAVSGSAQLTHTQELAWETTATDGHIEIANALSDMSSYTYGETRAADGKQFAELNAEQEASLYQTVLTVPGTTMYWSIGHEARSRCAEYGNVDHKDYEDTMYVVVMSEKMASELTTQAQVKEKILEVTGAPSWKALNGSGYATDTELSENSEISVYKITSKGDKWYKHGNTSTGYTVPEGQYTTRYLFVAGECAYDTYGNNSAINSTVGNLIDNIYFSTSVPPAKRGNCNVMITKTVNYSSLK